MEFKLRYIAGEKPEQKETQMVSVTVHNLFPNATLPRQRQMIFPLFVFFIRINRSNDKKTRVGEFRHSVYVCFK